MILANMIRNLFLRVQFSLGLLFVVSENIGVLKQLMGLNGLIVAIQAPAVMLVNCFRFS